MCVCVCVCVFIYLVLAHVRCPIPANSLMNREGGNQVGRSPVSRRSIRSYTPGILIKGETVISLSSHQGGEGGGDFCVREARSWKIQGLSASVNHSRHPARLRFDRIMMTESR